MGKYRTWEQEATIAALSALTYGCPPLDTEPRGTRGNVKNQDKVPLFGAGPENRHALVL